MESNIFSKTPSASSSDWEILCRESSWEVVKTGEPSWEAVETDENKYSKEKYTMENPCKNKEITDALNFINSVLVSDILANNDIFREKPIIYNVNKNDTLI